MVGKATLGTTYQKSDTSEYFDTPNIQSFDILCRSFRYDISIFRYLLKIATIYRHFDTIYRNFDLPNFRYDILKFRYFTFCRIEYFHTICRKNDTTIYSNFQYHISKVRYFDILKLSIRHPNTSMCAYLAPSARMVRLHLLKPLGQIVERLRSRHVVNWTSKRSGQVLEDKNKAVLARENASAAHYSYDEQR